jgi:iron complex outermembrane receptor protein
MRTPTLTAAAISLACGLSTPPHVLAQAAPDAAAPAVADDEVIVLSPFEVSTKKDAGYLAGNTLAGSRLNTELKDTAAAISVLTPEFLKDIGATNMKDVILFQNNAVPSVGDAAPNFNANPLMGSPAWNLRIRGLPASYARNYFAWTTSTDFFNVDRVDQSRGPNAILFGFGSAGGIVNTTTKQAVIGERDTEVGLTIGSWDRRRATLDYNQVLIPGKFAMRLNAVGDEGETWREWEFNEDRRVHLAAKWQISPSSVFKAEFEYGKVEDNIARPWLMIDQTYAWKNAGSPTFGSAQWSWPQSEYVTQTWSEHLVYTENNNTLMNWQGMPFSYSANQGWSHLAMTPENLAIIPIHANPGGGAALRENEYDTFTAVYEKVVSQAFSFELSYNHQSSDFLGYDPDAGNLTRYSYLGGATELWADASDYLPTWSTNPNAGRYYVENNWTRRTNTSDIDVFRGTASYESDLGAFGMHRVAGLYEYGMRDYYRVEDSEVFAGRPFATEAEFDSNRIFRRYYITPGEAATIRVPSWQQALVNVTDPVSGRTLSSAWVPNQGIDDIEIRQHTYLAALQSRFFKDRLVTILGYRRDELNHEAGINGRDAGGVLHIVPGMTEEADFSANTFSAGAVLDLTKNISVFGNTSTSRDLPNLNQTVIDGGLPQMPESKGYDVGVKFDLGSKLYATASYYTTDVEKTTEWGNIKASVSDLNNRILDVFVTDGLITGAQRDARRTNADSYYEDRESKGWEFTLVANPTANWRVSANFSINEVVKSNIMNEIASWADTNTAFWRATGGDAYLLGGGSWDTVGNQIGWMTDYIDRERAFSGKPARGERKYGANLYSRYRFSSGALKGLSFGGGGRYQSANIVGMENPGTAHEKVLKGEKLFLADASIGYDFPLSVLGHKTWVELQVNASNVFDNDDYQVYTSAWWDSTRPERIGLQEPRKITFSATVKF